MSPEQRSHREFEHMSLSLCTQVVIWKGCVSLYSVCKGTTNLRDTQGKNDKNLYMSKKSSTFVPAVPVIPLPDMMLVMNPVFLFVWHKEMGWK